jgi:hypothetical protein
MFRVLFRSVVVMIGSVQRMAVRDFRVVRGFFVMPGFVMLRRLVVVVGRLFMMMRGFLTVLVNVVIHDPLLSQESAALQGAMKHLRPVDGSRK